MVKAFALFGCIVSICLSQGCGGKKADTASATPADASSPTLPGMEAGSSEVPVMGAGANSSNADLASMSGMPGQGNQGGTSGAAGYGDGYNGGGMPGSEGTSMPGLDGNGNQPQPGFDPNGMPGRQNPNRPRPKPLPPPTLKEQAIKAFQAGNAKRAYTLLQAHALQLPDEEAAEILKDYRWASHRKQPQLGVNIAVGVTIKNPLNATDLSPIGTETKNQAGGGGGDLGFGSAGGAAGMGEAGGAADPSISKTLIESTGVLSTRLAQVFKERHEKGVWAPAFQEYWLVTKSENGNGGMAGGGFDGGGYDSGSGDGGFGNGYNGFGNGSDGFNDGGAGMPLPPGQGSPSGLGPRQGDGSQQRGSSTPPGMSVDGGSPSGNSGGNSGSGGAVQPGSSSSRFHFLQGGIQGMFGGGRGPGGGTPPAMGNNAMLPTGSTPISPCLTFIGVDDSTKLMKKAVQHGYDGLMIFEVTISVNQALQRYANDTLVRVVEPNIVSKDVKKVFLSRPINNIQVAMKRAKGEQDGVDDMIEKVVKSIEGAFGLQAIPTGLTPEIIATKRIPVLIKETETSVVERLSEVNFYYYQGYLDETQKDDAFEKIAGQAGRVIAVGSPTEKLAEVGKLLEREFK